MNKEELEKTIENHELWVSSNGREGVKANLRGANLRCANLRGADLSQRVSQFSASKQHVALLIGDNLRIGCKHETLEWWLENGEALGRENEYTEEEIKMYMNFIKMVSDKNE